jgi:hypothetical protein
MEENYLFGLLVFVFLGLVTLIKPEREKQGIKREQEASSYNKTSGVSGVAKYLQAKIDTKLQNKATGVAKYLQEKEELNIAKTENLVISGVAKYLDTKKQASASGVTRYMARQAVYAKKVAAENVSGVEKYLKSRS